MYKPFFHGLSVFPGRTNISEIVQLVHFANGAGGNFAISFPRLINHENRLSNKQIVRIHNVKHDDNLHNRIMNLVKGDHNAFYEDFVLPDSSPQYLFFSTRQRNTSAYHERQIRSLQRKLCNNPTNPEVILQRIRRETEKSNSIKQQSCDLFIPMKSNSSGQPFSIFIDVKKIDGHEYLGHTSYGFSTSEKTCPLPV